MKIVILLLIMFVTVTAMTGSKTFLGMFAGTKTASDGGMIVRAVAEGDDWWFRSTDPKFKTCKIRDSVSIKFFGPGPVVDDVEFYGATLIKVWR